MVKNVRVALTSAVHCLPCRDSISEEWVQVRLRQARLRVQQLLTKKDKNHGNYEAWLFHLYRESTR
jgi:hypothetical protein